MASQWSTKLLRSLSNAQTIQVAPNYADSPKLNPQTVWFVRVGNDIYVRAYRGTKSKWYRAAVKQGTGKVYFHHQAYPARFQPVDPKSSVNKTVNQNYLAKYHGDSMLWMVETALDSTLKILKG